MHNRSKFKSKLNLTGLFVGVAAIAGAAIITAPVNAEGTTLTDTLNVEIITACTMTRTDNTGGNYAVSMMPGTSTTLGDTTIKVICNDNNGYSIYATGYSGNRYTGGNNNKLLGTYGNINTGTSGTDSYWAMKVTAIDSGTYTPTIVNSFDSASFHAVPDSYTQVAKLTKATDAGVSAIGSNFQANYKISLAGNQVADTYTGKVKYVLINPNTATPGTYTIAYNANGGSGTMESSTGIYTFDAFELPESTFTAPSGYEFAGWCTTQDTSQNPQTTCGGTSYDAGDEVIGLATAGETANLYAYWESSCQSTVSGSMQAFDPSVLCSGVTSGTLTDSRGGTQSYTVAKLADGKWWMVENLNLAGGTALSADDTDVTSAYISSFSTSNRLTKNGNTIVLPASSTGFDTNNYSYVYNSGNKTTSQSDCTDSQSCNSYYSWDAATLGSGRSISTENTNAEQSICPKGWKLPSTYNGSGTAAAATDFRALMIGYSGSDSVQTYNSSTSPTGATMYSNIGPGSTPNFLLAGLYGNGSFLDGGSYGGCWSSTSYSNTSRARYLGFGSTVVYSARNDYRSSGYSVRCLFSS